MAKEGGFTAFFSEFPSIMSEGDTIDEAEVKLFDLLHMALPVIRKMEEDDAMENLEKHLEPQTVSKRSYDFKLQNVKNNRREEMSIEDYLKSVVSDDIYKKYRKWYNKKYKHDVGAIGGALAYSFTPTGLGMIVVVKCADGTEFDLSESDKW